MKMTIVVRRMRLIGLLGVYLFARGVFADTQSPNVLVVLVDDMGWSDLGCYGSEIHTPTVDTLAANGRRFRYFYNEARCAPTRIALMSGQHMQTAGVNPNAGLPHLRTDNNITLPEIFSANGYRSYFAGKWHLGRQLDDGIPVNRDPISRGFQHVFGQYADAGGPGGDYWADGTSYTFISSTGEMTANTYPADGFYKPDVVGDYVLKYLDHHYGKEDDAPFFIYMAFNAPHFKLQAPTETIDLYTDAGQDPAQTNDVDVYRYEAGWNETRQLRYDRQLADGVIGSEHRLGPMSYDPKNLVSMPGWDELDSNERNDLSRRMATYAAMVHKMDENLGRVIDRITTEGELDNTIVVFFADNGGNYEGGITGSTQNGTEQNGSFPLTGERLEQMGQMGEPKLNLGGGWANVNNTPLRFFKRQTHEGGCRTPLVIHWPDGLATNLNGSWTDERGHVTDLMPTLLDMTGLAYPSTNPAGYAVEPLSGSSLRPVLQGGTLPERDLAIEHERSRSFYRGKWKLVCKDFTMGGTDLPADALELYNLEEDASELNNLAFHETELLADLATAFNAWVDSQDGLNANRKLTVTTVDTNVFAMPLGDELLYDTFNRADTDDTDASRGGISGTLPTWDHSAVSNLYYEGYNSERTLIQNNRLRMANGAGMSENGIMHNFVESTIVDAGGFSVELTVSEINTAETDLSNRYGGFGIGLSQAEAASGGNNATLTTFRGTTALTNGVSDCFVDLDYSGCVNLWTMGELVESVNVGTNSGTILTSFQTPGGFEAGSNVVVHIFFNGHLIDMNNGDSDSSSRSFAWSTTESNHIGLSCRGTGYVEMDNLAVRTLPLSYALSSGYALSTGLTGSATDKDMDLDGDGLDNEAEWVWGGNPAIPDAQVAVATISNAAGNLVIGHRQLKDAAVTGTDYHVAHSANLVLPRTLWGVTNLPPVTIYPAHGQPRHEQAERMLPVDGKTRFFRIEASTGNH